MTDHYNLSLDRFAWCWQARGEHYLRLAFTGVYVEPREAGGVYMVATDGIITAVAVDEDGACPEPLIISVGADIERLFGPETYRDQDGDECHKWNLDPNGRLQFRGLADAKIAIAETPYGHGAVYRIDGTARYWREAALSEQGPPIPGPVGAIDPGLLSKLSYRGGAVSIYPRFGIAPKSKDKSLDTMVLCDKAPWACGFIKPLRIDAWERDSDLARELLGDEEPPLRLAVWPEEGA